MWGLVCLALLGLASGPAFADICDKAPTVDEWVSKYLEGANARIKALDEIRLCTATKPARQLTFDTLAVLSLRAAEMSDAGSRRDGYIRFNADLLWILAKNGFASSQHNLATLHNARPGTPTHSAIRQDQPLFLYWTRKAAAQGEIRALFNLAARLSRGVPEAGLTKDAETAYKILHRLLEGSKGLEPQMPELLTAIRNEKARTLADIGTDRAAELVKETWNFASLAPVEPQPYAEWDHLSNAVEALHNLSRLQRSEGKDAVWRYQQKCYADLEDLRTFTRAHEACMLTDIANTQIAQTLHNRPGETPKQNLLEQYEKKAFIERLAGALLKAGLSYASMAKQLEALNALLGKALDSDAFKAQQK